MSGIGAQRNSEKNQVECDCAESHWSKEHHITTYIGVHDKTNHTLASQVTLTR